MGQKFTITEQERNQIRGLYEQSEISSQSLNEQSEGNPLVYSQIVDVPNMPKDQLYDRIKQWLASAFKSLQNVNQLDDKVNGIFIGHGNMSWKSRVPSMMCASGYIEFEMKIQVKDNKFKMQMSDFSHVATAKYGDMCTLGLITDKEIYKTGILGGPYNKIWNQAKEDTKMYFDGLFNSLQTKIKSDKPDDF